MFRFFKKQKYPVSFNQFSLFTRANSNGRPVFILVEETLLTENFDRKVFSSEYILQIIINEPNGSGGPTGNESDTLNKYEDQILQILDLNKVSCLFAGRTTEEGLRNIIFEVSDQKSFIKFTNKFIQSISSHKIKIVKNDGWRYFDRVMTPDESEWEMIRNQRVIDGLIKYGSNPEKIHNIEFAFFGDYDRLKSLRKDLALDGFEFVDENNPEMLVMSKRMPLDAAIISKYTVRFRSKEFVENGIELDGWATAIEK